jgi:hypothetical protein
VAGGKKQKLLNVKADQRIKVNIATMPVTIRPAQPKIDFKALFKEVTDSLGLQYKHNSSRFYRL